MESLAKQLQILHLLKNIYKNAIPHKENIEKINKLYDEGNYIKYWTGRGSVTKINHYDLTKKQLNEWGCFLFPKKINTNTQMQLIQELIINLKWI